MAPPTTKEGVMQGKSFARRGLLIAVAVLAGSALMPVAPRAAAQDAPPAATVMSTVTPEQRAAAQQYLSTAVVGATDLLYYRQEDASSQEPLAGEVASWTVLFFPASASLPGVSRTRVTATIYENEAEAVKAVAGFRQPSNDREPRGSTLSISPEGALTDVVADESISFRFTRRFDTGNTEAGAGATWRLGTLVFLVSVTGDSRVVWLPEATRIARVQAEKFGRTPAPASTP
jgi:hypothetical protein